MKIYVEGSFIDVGKYMIANPTDEFTDYVASNGCKIVGNYLNGTLLIYYMFVPEGKRNKGLLREFLQQSHTFKIKKLVILAVQSDVLDEYLQRFICSASGAKFKSQGGDYILKFPA